MLTGGTTVENGNIERPVAIIGAGPAGLSAAIEAQSRELRYVVLERDKAASTVRGFPPGKKVYSEPRSLENQSALTVEDYGAAVSHVRKGGSTIVLLPPESPLDQSGLRPPKPPRPNLGATGVVWDLDADPSENG